MSIYSFEWAWRWDDNEGNVAYSINCVICCRWLTRHTNQQRRFAELRDGRWAKAFLFCCGLMTALLLFHFLQLICQTMFSNFPLNCNYFILKRIKWHPTMLPLCPPAPHMRLQWKMLYNRSMNKDCCRIALCCYSGEKRLLRNPWRACIKHSPWCWGQLNSHVDRTSKYINEWNF